MMTKRRYILSGITAFLIFAVLLLWHAITVRQAEAALLDRTAAILALLPDQEQTIISVLKEPDDALAQKGYGILSQYGYTRGNRIFLHGHDYVRGVLPAVVFALCLGLIVLLLCRREVRQQQKRVASLTEYLGQVNAGQYHLRPGTQEDVLSPLEDELYKTIVLLREGREQATAARQSLADNLADIAHQLKTPLSSITLLADTLLVRENAGEQAEQISAQAEKMSRLVSALLTLSRMDAGTLILEHKQVNVDELCECAADAVLPLFGHSGISLYLPETGASYTGDMAWSIQAVANILKNCYEHSRPGGEIIVTSEENPLYTSINIEDNGPGIPHEDLPHLFERFYRGKHAKRDSAGIGLALSKALVEGQNGTLTAENRPDGGARFILKFYHTK